MVMVRRVLEAWRAQGNLELLQNVLAANGKGMCGRLWADGVLSGLSWENCSPMKRRSFRA